MTADALPTRSLVLPAAAATRALGQRLGAAAQAGDVIALIGPLGAGKTELARGVARGLDVAGPVSSPTFIVIAEHEGRLPLFHVDAYRLAGPEDALGAGLLDERRADGVTVIEWAERLGAALPAARLEIRIDGSGDEPRTCLATATDDRHARLLVAMTAEVTAEVAAGVAPGESAGASGVPGSAAAASGSLDRSRVSA